MIWLDKGGVKNMTKKQIERERNQEVMDGILELLKYSKEQNYSNCKISEDFRRYGNYLDLKFEGGVLNIKHEKGEMKSLRFDEITFEYFEVDIKNLNEYIIELIEDINESKHRKECNKALGIIKSLIGG